MDKILKSKKETNKHASPSSMQKPNGSQGRYPRHMVPANGGGPMKNRFPLVSLFIMASMAMGLVLQASSQKNPAKIIPLFAAAQRVENMAAYSFLLDVLHYLPQTSFELFSLDLGNEIGPLLIYKYSPPGIPQTIEISGFLGNATNGFRCVLEPVILWFGPFRMNPSERYDLYVNDLDEDGIREIVSVKHQNTENEHLRIYSYNSALGILVGKDIGMTSLGELIAERGKGPITLDQVGYTIRPAYLKQSRWHLKPSGIHNYSLADIGASSGSANALERFQHIYFTGGIPIEDLTYKIENLEEKNTVAITVQAKMSGLKPGIYSFIFHWISKTGTCERIEEIPLDITRQNATPTTITIEPQLTAPKYEKRAILHGSTVDTLVMQWTEQCSLHLGSGRGWVLDRVNVN
jgi:hypothetical protein